MNFCLGYFLLNRKYCLYINNERKSGLEVWRYNDLRQRFIYLLQFHNYAVTNIAVISNVIETSQIFYMESHFARDFSHLLLFQSTFLCVPFLTVQNMCDTVFHEILEYYDKNTSL